MKEDSFAALVACIAFFVFAVVLSVSVLGESFTTTVVLEVSGSQVVVESEGGSKTIDIVPNSSVEESFTFTINRTIDTPDNNTQLAHILETLRSLNQTNSINLDDATIEKVRVIQKDEIRQLEEIIKNSFVPNQEEKEVLLNQIAELKQDIGKAQARDISFEERLKSKDVQLEAEIKRTQLIENEKEVWFTLAILSFITLAIILFFFIAKELDLFGRRSRFQIFNS